jgi:hypothetical protein
LGCLQIIIIFQFVKNFNKKVVRKLEPKKTKKDWNPKNIKKIQIEQITKQLNEKSDEKYNYNTPTRTFLTSAPSIERTKNNGIFTVENLFSKRKFY